MSVIALTGANGFLGWHTRAALYGDRPIRSFRVGDDFNADDASVAMEGAHRLIHMAGVNRGTDDQIHDGNIHFATQVADALVKSANPPGTVVFANSKQARNGTVYGEAKSQAAEILRLATEKIGARFEDVLLPNLFGEHGLPFYNAVTATFGHLLARGSEPTVEDDKELTLLHVQDAADILIGAVGTDAAGALQVRESVGGLLKRLRAIAAAYNQGDIPDISTKFDRDLFNTYRSYTFPGQAPVALHRHADARGSFFEILRTRGGTGQTSFSTTEPGISRGDHFHRRKIERFTVLAGTATISLRKMFTDEVHEFQVTGESPVAVDMPTMWTHKITNTGTDTLYTSFWTNEIFDPTAPDTIPEPV
ncbi:capsular biosynthesis protein [Arthrobacter sp. AB6]|uniref:polysaccharide biosynthesis C-terminal domain-containing protein n=1 Tax=Arthrobacter sp. AB6 TaxID=2962570 RepID=UPI002881B09E|nr:capsular biosynthesis protein [Arthrobacter sp. AB6]MDT0193806.1 capsular biosynthesis protein [Arthrobacter sp. AB6]